MVMARRDNMFTRTPAHAAGGHAGVGRAEDRRRPGGSRPAASASPGKVVGADGKPVSGAVVTAGAGARWASPSACRSAKAAPRSPQAVSDHDGELRPRGSAGRASTPCGPPIRRTPTASRRASRPAPADVTVRLQGGASVAGVVRTRDGKPVTDYTIAALARRPPGRQPQRAHAQPDDRAHLEPDRRRCTIPRAPSSSAGWRPAPTS